LGPVLLKRRLLLTRVTAVAVVAAFWLPGARPAVGGLAAGTALMVAGQLLRLWAAGHLVKREVLTTTGPFAHLRHPLYWGSMLSGLGLCVATRIWWSYLAVAVVFTLVYVPTLLDEERALQRIYGEAYRRYLEAVPRFGLRLRGYRAPQNAAGPSGGGFRWHLAWGNGEHRTMAATVLLLALLWGRLVAAGGMR
jgi:protein-S-isoprenylcysteine O-methyltransferase Ste14